jgi:hypothetical protein
LAEAVLEIAIAYRRHRTGPQLRRTGAKCRRPPPAAAFFWSQKYDCSTLAVDSSPVFQRYWIFIQS